MFVGVGVCVCVLDSLSLSLVLSPSLSLTHTYTHAHTLHFSPTLRLAQITFGGGGRHMSARPGDGGQEKKGF